MLNIVEWKINRFGHIELKKEKESLYTQTDTEVKSFLDMVGADSGTVSGFFNDDDYGYFG